MAPDPTPPELTPAEPALAEPKSPEPRRGRATGPRTAAGKRRSSRNAQRHGLTAAQTDPAACAAQLARLRADPALAGLDEGLLARFVAAELRAARACAYQHALLADAPGAEAHALRCALRYRAEAEVAARKARRAVIDALEARHRRRGGAI